MAKTYNLYDWLAERRAALEQWAEFVQSLAEGKGGVGWQRGDAVAFIAPGETAIASMPLPPKSPRLPRTAMRLAESRKSSRAGRRRRTPEQTNGCGARARRLRAWPCRRTRQRR